MRRYLLMSVGLLLGIGDATFQPMVESEVNDLLQTVIVVREKFTEGFSVIVFESFEQMRDDLGIGRVHREPPRSMFVHTDGIFRANSVKHHAKDTLKRELQRPNQT